MDMRVRSTLDALSRTWLTEEKRETARSLITLDFDVLKNNSYFLMLKNKYLSDQGYGVRQIMGSPKVSFHLILGPQH